MRCSAAIPACSRSAEPRLLCTERRSAGQLRPRRAEENPRCGRLPDRTTLRRRARAQLFRRWLHRRPRGARRGAAMADRLQRRHRPLPRLQRHGAGPAVRPHHPRPRPARRLPQPGEACRTAGSRDADLRWAGRARDGVVSHQAACNARFDPARARLNGKTAALPGRCRHLAALPVGCADPGAAGVQHADPLQLPAGQRRDPLPRLQHRAPTSAAPGACSWWSTASASTPCSRATRCPCTAPGSPRARPTIPASDEWVRFFVTRNPTFNSLTLDPQNPGPWQARISELSLRQTSTGPTSPRSPATAARSSWPTVLPTNW